MAENTRPHEAPLKLDLATQAKQKQRPTPSTMPMSSDRIYNMGLLEEETGRTQLISPPPEETLAFRRTSRTTPNSSASKRKRNVTQLQQPLQPVEATPNPKPRKQTRRQSTPIDSPTRPQSTPSNLNPNRNSLVPKSPHALNPNADFLPPSAPRSARARRTTPIPPYEPPSDVFTPPREVIMTPSISKSSKRKTGTASRTKPKSTAKPLRVVLSIKKELPDIDLSLPMPPPSPSDDPLLLSGPLLPPTSTPTRAPRQRKNVGVITSASLALSPVPEPFPTQTQTRTPTRAESLPPSSEPDPLPSSFAEPPVYFNWDAPQPPTSDTDDSMDLDPADADVPAPPPLFPPSAWTETDAGGWSDSDDDGPAPAHAPGDAVEVGEGEYTGRYHTLNVRTKLDPPSSATRVRMEDWGRPITPFPRKIARPDFLGALEEGCHDVEAAQCERQSAGPGVTLEGGAEQVEDVDVEMGGDEEEEDEEERQVREMSVPLSSAGADLDNEDEDETPNAPHDASHEEELPQEGQSYTDDSPSYESSLPKETLPPQEGTIAQDASVSVDESFEIPLPPPRTPYKTRFPTPAEEGSDEEEEEFDLDLGQEVGQEQEHEEEQGQDILPEVDLSLDTQASHNGTTSTARRTSPRPATNANYDGDTESHHSHSSDGEDEDEEEAEEREVRDMSVSYDDEDDIEVGHPGAQEQAEGSEEPTSYITFSPTTPAPALSVPTPTVVFSPLHTPAPVFSPPALAPASEDKNEDTQMRDEHGRLPNMSRRTGPVGLDMDAGAGAGAEVEAGVEAEAEADSNPSESDTEVEADVVRITSADPRAAARAAAILKQHDYACYTKLILRQKSQDRRRTTVLGGGIHKPSTPAAKPQRRATLGGGIGGMLGDRVYIPGTPTMTLPELLREAEAQVALSTTTGPSTVAPPTRCSLGTPLSRAATTARAFGTPLVTTPLPRRHTITALSTGTQAWTKEEWKLLDACFTDARLERGVAGVLAPVDAVHINEVVSRFLALFDDPTPWDRSDIQQRVKALQNKQRAGHVAPPTTPYTPSPATTGGAFGLTRRVPSMEVPDFTPLGRRALPPRKQRPAPVLVADTTSSAPFASLPAEAEEEEEVRPVRRTAGRTVPATLLAPRYSHLLEEAVAVSMQPTIVADAAVAGIESQEVDVSTDITTPEIDDTDEDDASFEATLPDEDTTTTAPQPTPSTLGTRVKGFLFSYLPRSKSTSTSTSKLKRPAQRGLPLPPPSLLAKPRGPITTPIRAPVPKPTHPRELVHLQPAPAPPRTTKIPRAAVRPQRLVELHPLPPPVATVPVAPRARRSSGGSVKDLVRGFEELDAVKDQGEARRAELKRVRSVGEWRKGLVGKAGVSAGVGGSGSGKPGWKP